MVPFLEHGFVDVLHTLLKMVIKPDVLDQANSSLKLSKLDLSNPENLLPCELMKFPTATKSSLQSADLSNEKQRSSLKNAKQMIVVLVQKVQECCQIPNCMLRILTLPSYLISRNVSTILTG